MSLYQHEFHRPTWGTKSALANDCGPETGGNLLVGPTRWCSLESGSGSRNPKAADSGIDDHTLPPETRLPRFWHRSNQVSFQNLQLPLLSCDFWLHMGLFPHSCLWLNWTADCLTLPRITWWDQAMVYQLQGHQAGEQRRSKHKYESKRLGSYEKHAF